MISSITNTGVSARRREHLTDEELIKQARNGEFDAFEVIFDRHRSMVYRYVYHMIPRRDDAEDIVQEAFVKAYQNLGKYRDQAKFTTWLLRIATNLATDSGRTSVRRQGLEQQEAAGALEWMTVGFPEDPLNNIEKARIQQILSTAISQLPVHHKAAIILRDIENREYSDIAEVFGCSLGGAKLRVLRARRVLRDKVKPMLNNNDEGSHV